MLLTVTRPNTVCLHHGRKFKRRNLSKSLQLAALRQCLFNIPAQRCFFVITGVVLTLPILGGGMQGGLEKIRKCIHRQFCSVRSLSLKLFQNPKNCILHISTRRTINHFNIPGKSGCGTKCVSRPPPLNCANDRYVGKKCTPVRFLIKMGTSKRS